MYIAVCQSFTGFNSMIVRLKGKGGSGYTRCLIPFQFYDSPIKIDCVQPRSTTDEVFQFYDSPIKIYTCCLQTDAIYRFNSMIVRLKAHVQAIPRTTIPRFQFYDSPIKSLIIDCCGNLQKLFQFYDSPIKRFF